jgi:thiamine-phosphate pyrophosphorylase
MFSLLVITPETNRPQEIKIIISLFNCGLKILHVRKPTFTEDELRNYLKEIPKQFYNKIIIHSHYKLAKEFSLKGIHLTEKARKSKRINSSLKIISASFHSVEDVLKSRRNYKYIFLSPVFNSISKQGYKSNFNLEELEPFLKKRKNIVALGGINTKNIKSIKQAGFAGAAILGCVWKSKNPVKAYKEIALKIK